METHCDASNVMATPASADQGNYEALCAKRSADSRKIQELEARLSEQRTVTEWRLEQLKEMKSDKRAAEKTLEEERKLFGEMSLDQIRQNAQMIEALQEHWFRLMGDKNVHGNASGFQQPPVESDSVRRLQKSLDGMRQQLKLRSDERDKLKAKCKKLEEDAAVGQQKMKKLTMDLIEQLDQRNSDLQRRAESSVQYELKLAKLRQEIQKGNEEIQKLKGINDDQNLNKTEGTACIICMDEFGEDPDRQRAHWKDCNHANVCFKCSNTLWSSKKRKCPSCSTPASSMPGRLNVYL